MAHIFKASQTNPKSKKKKKIFYRNSVFCFHNFPMKFEEMHLNRPQYYLQTDVLLPFLEAISCSCQLDFLSLIAILH